MPIQPLSRRSAIRGGGVFAVSAVAGFLLAGPHRARGRKAQTVANAYGPSPQGAGRRVAELTDLAPGALRVYPDAKVVLLRGSGDTVSARSAICTHQGCLVAAVPQGQLLCPCHGSRFQARDGAVVNGPATHPLPPVAVEVRDGAVWTT